jgi:hypothetical protein
MDEKKQTKHILLWSDKPKEVNTRSANTRSANTRESKCNIIFRNPILRSDVYKKVHSTSNDRKELILQFLLENTCDEMLKQIYDYLN